MTKEELLSMPFDSMEEKMAWLEEFLRWLKDHPHG